MSFNPGGGGIAAASDVALNSPANDEVLTYETSTAKWRNKVGTGASPAVLAQKVAHYTNWTVSTAYAVGDYVKSGTTIFRVVNAHTSSEAPTTANSAPTTPGADYEVWAAAGNSPNSLVMRSSTNEVTVQMVYIMNVPSVPTSGANKQYVDDTVAEAVLQARPPMLARVVWNGSAWTYRDQVITARPGDLSTGDGLIFIGNPGGTLPTWAATNDLWTQG